MTTAITTDETGFRAQRVRRLGVGEPVRDERIVHSLDGILAPVTAAQLHDTGRTLWQRWSTEHPDREPDLLLGLDAGGIVPTIALAQASSLPYQLAWKLHLDLPHRRAFTEPHARRTNCYLYADLADRRVLVVDDEVTTGRTIGNLTDVLRACGARVLGVAALVEDTTGGGRALLATKEVPLCALEIL